jgi:hypothetical protein
VVRVPGYRSRGYSFDSRPYHIFWEVRGSETGSTQPREDNWGATWMKQQRRISSPGLVMSRTGSSVMRRVCSPLITVAYLTWKKTKVSCMWSMKPRKAHASLTFLHGVTVTRMSSTFFFHLTSLAIFWGHFTSRKITHCIRFVRTLHCSENN